MKMPSAQDVNVARCFALVAHEHPDHEAIVAADIVLSYAKLWRIVRGFAVRMQQLGIGRESLVAIHSRDMVACVASMMATSLLGAGFAAFDRRLLADGGPVRATHVLRSPDAPPHPDVTYHLMDATWPQAAPPAPASNGSEFPSYADARDPWWFVQTSGTTGEPKYLSLSQQDVYHRSLAVESDFRPLHTRLCSLFPCNTRPFFARANAALLNACTVVDTVDFSFMQAKGVNLVCGAPAVASEYLGNSRISPKIAVLQVSGAKTPDADAMRFLQSFETVEDVYGASETSKTFVNVKGVDSGQLTTRGKPLDSELQIVGADGKPVPASGTLGIVRVRNNYMASSYIGAPKASQRAFRDGWFYPGDVASWGSAGELVVAGRLDDIVNLGGIKINLADVDEVLCSVDGISTAAAFHAPAEPHHPPRLMAMVTLSSLGDAEKCVAAAHAACRERYGANVAPRAILVVPSIPVTADGAPRRKACMALAQAMMAKNIASRQL
jgi:long-chain acyl-CoA synthetase